MAPRPRGMRRSARAVAVLAALQRAEAYLRERGAER